jgi:hypothetical protein
LKYIFAFKRLVTRSGCENLDRVKERWEGGTIGRPSGAFQSQKGLSIVRDWKVIQGRDGNKKK